MTTTAADTETCTCVTRYGVCGAIVTRRAGRVFDVATNRPHSCSNYATLKAGHRS